MNLYVHIPFCRRLCGYCDFHKNITRQNVDWYADTICRQMEQYADFADNHLGHIYIGGGTPSVMSPEALQRILTSAQTIWNTPSEVTLEANPDDLTEEYLARLADTDFNRLSIGIQSFNDDELRLMNRRHTARQAVEAVERARRYGFRNISIDLIYGIPNSTLKTWQTTLDEAVRLGVEHISSYHLSIEEGTPFAKRNLSPVSEELSEAQYNALHDTLTKAGFQHYEISNFALPDYHSRHNSDYWNGTPYLGLGEGAHSFDGDRKRWSIEIRNEELVIMEETLSDEELYEEFVMLRLRTSRGFDIGDMRKKLDDTAAARFITLAAPLIKEGLLISDSNLYRIPHSHWLISDTIIGRLV